MLFLKKYIWGEGFIQLCFKHKEKSEPRSAHLLEIEPILLIINNKITTIGLIIIVLNA